MTKAIVLLSGGLDSATALAIAQSEGYACYTLSFHYGQRHASELVAAERVARAAAVEEHRVFPLELSVFGGSALTDPALAVPERQSKGIPSTYVPARNTVFLSIALAWAEVLNVQDIFIGVNAVDYSGYPDCRPQFIQAFEAMANLATKAALEGQELHIHAPLIALSKAQIINIGAELGVDYSLTVSCYQANEQGAACGVCDSCRLRAQGFRDAAIEDPTFYIERG